MAFTRINDKEYETAKKIVKKKMLDYPTISNYISKAVSEKNKKEDMI